MTAIGNILNFAQGAQALKQGNVNLQRSQATLPADIARAQADSTTAQAGAQTAQQANVERQNVMQYVQQNGITDASGNIDIDRLNKDIPAIAPQTGTSYLSNWQTLGKAQTDANQAKLNFTGDERKIVGNLYGVLGRANVTDPKVIGSELDNLATQYPDNKNMQKYIQSAKVGLAQAQPSPDLPKHLVTQSQALLSPGEQQSQLSPQVGLTHTGGEQLPTVTQPAVGGNAPSITVGASGTGIADTLPPTTTRFNQATGAQEYVGNVPGGASPGGARTVMQGDPATVIKQLSAIPDPQQRSEALEGYKQQLSGMFNGGQASPVQAGPALGQPQVADAVVGDWKNVSDAAKTASQDIGVLQTIKQHATGAVTGVESDRRSYAAGIAGLLGMDSGQIEKTDTDLLAKNANMLAAQGGHTDAERTLASAMNPNNHMTKEAIQQAANQVIGQRQLALERQRYLQPYVSNPTVYNQKATEFNQVADPRILQLPNMSQAEKVQMKAAMSPQEQAQFGQKIRSMQQLGILR